MYSQNNNRIITKYSEFLKEQAETEPDFIPPTLITSSKHVIDPHYSPPSPHDLRQEEDSDSGRESPTAHTSSTMTVTSAEVHNIESEGESSSDPPTAAVPLTYPAEQFTSSKFSDLFTLDQSHALLQRELLVQSDEGSFLRDALSAQKVKPAFEYVDPPDGHAEAQNDLNSESRERARDSPRSSSIPAGRNVRSRPSRQGTYPPSPPGSSLAETEVSLRRELLNNIRAISRATFFEKLYMGNGKSGDELDAGECSDTSNNPSTAANNKELEELLRTESPAQALVVSEKSGLLVFEAESPQPKLTAEGESEQSGEGRRALLDVQDLTQVGDLDKESSIHQWILNSRNESETEGAPPDVTADIPELAYYSSPEIASAQEEHVEIGPDEQRSLPGSVVRTGSGIAASEQSQIVDKPKRVPNGTAALSHVSDTGSTSSRFTPIFSRVELEGDGDTKPYRRRPFPLLPPAVTVPLKSLTHSVLSNPLNKQVRYPSVLPTRLSPPFHNTGPGRRLPVNLPGVLLRTDMDQWVAKIVRFYVNGDEHLPRFEYRFRPGRDVHGFDSLCDVLTERLGKRSLGKLTCGVRYIFSIDGQPIWGLEELRHEGAYVVSSTKKFKALNYGGELVGVESKGGAQSKRRGRSRPPSAPSQRNPPIIRVRRERSLNGVVWGSPQQDWSSGSERNTRAHLQLQQSAIEAEKVLRAAIEESQAQSGAPPPGIVTKQIIRIINGSDPTIQSQVLLNTRVSQEFQELVKDLGLAVKIPRAVESRMETLTGRAIQSYSQLRSQLKAGNEAFYIYNLSTNPSSSTTASRGGAHHHLLTTGDRSSPFGSMGPMSKSVSNPTLGHLEASLGKKFPNSIVHLAPPERSITRNSNKLKLPSFGGLNKSSSSSSIYYPEVVQSGTKTESPRQAQTKGVKGQNAQGISNSSSHPNLHQKRKSLRERYETSNYLARHPSRSPSP